MIQVVCGSSSELIHLTAVEIKNEYISQSYEILELDKQSSRSDLQNAFSVSMFGSDKKLIVIHDPTKIKKLSVFLKEIPPYDFLIVHDGGYSFHLDSVVGDHKIEKIILDQPEKPWKRPEWALKIFMGLVKDKGKKIDSELCRAIIRRVGTDIGVLRFELEKIMQVSEGGEITAQDVVDVISPLQSLSGVEVIDSIFSKNSTRFLKEMARYEKNRVGNNMKGFTQGYFFNNLLESLTVLLCSEKGMGFEEMASLIHKKPYVIKERILPRAKHLGKVRIKKLLNVLYELETEIDFEGVDPLVYFKASVLSILR